MDRAFCGDCPGQHCGHEARPRGVPRGRYFPGGHSLKGSCSNFGASALAELCAQIEHAADDGNLNGMGDLIASAEKELARVIEALKTRLKSKNTP
jgi:hypothetical protein